MTEPTPAPNRDKVITGAMLGSGDPLNPFAVLRHRLLARSRFTSGRLYRLLWGHHPKPDETGDSDRCPKDVWRCSSTR